MATTGWRSLALATRPTLCAGPSTEGLSTPRSRGEPGTDASGAPSCPLKSYAVSKSEPLRAPPSYWAPFSRPQGGLTRLLLRHAGWGANAPPNTPHIRPGAEGAKPSHKSGQHPNFHPNVHRHPTDPPFPCPPSLTSAPSGTSSPGLGVTGHVGHLESPRRPGRLLLEVQPAARGPALRRGGLRLLVEGHCCYGIIRWLMWEPRS